MEMDVIATQEIFANILGIMGILATATVGIVTVAKNAHFPNDYSGLLAVVVGVGLSFLAFPVYVPGTPVGGMALAGIIIGLTAAGAYSAPKAIADKISSV